MIRIGTRGSKLAVWQAHHVAERLTEANIEAEIITIETKGDKMLNKPMSKLGSKGVFTAELEEQLKIQKIDIAVHSAKDLQSDLPDGLEILAYMKREDPHDVLVSYNTNTKMSDFDRTFVIGTSSTRRVALLRHYYPHIRTADSRGNLQTRMKKLDEGYYDALVLSYAGVARMNFQQYIVEKLPVETFTPPVGQGCIAIECHRDLDDDKKDIIYKLLNDKNSENCLLAERSFLKTLQGGCSIPSFGLATLDENNQITLVGGIISIDGQQIVRDTQRGNHKDALDLGEHTANEVLRKGGDRILEEIKKVLF